MLVFDLTFELYCRAQNVFWCDHMVTLVQCFPNFLVIGTLWTIYRFARVPTKFSHIFGCEAQLALMHNLFSIARQPITFLLSFLKTSKLIILTFILSFIPWQIS